MSHTVEKLLILAIFGLALYVALHDEDWISVGEPGDASGPGERVMLDRHSAHREGDIGWVRMRQGDGAAVSVAFDCIRRERLDRFDVTAKSSPLLLEGMPTACDPRKLFWQKWFE